jgi:hypothetical protein
MRERLIHAMDQALRDERERCAKALCLYCGDTANYGPPKEIEGSKRLWHSDLRNKEYGVIQCQAAAIRRSGSAEGCKEDGSK